MTRGVAAAFDHYGRYGSVTGASWVHVIEPGVTGPTANLVVGVEQGRVRAYLADKDGYRYVEAAPGNPARLRGDMILLHRYRFVLEAVDGEARGVSYRIWR